MTDLERPAIWSSQVSEADWVSQALRHPVSSPDEFVVGGFEAYGQVMHPAEEGRREDRVVRWSEVAAWSGLPLEPQAGFESIALPQSRPVSPRPWAGQGPDIGRLYGPYVEALVTILREWTQEPDSCWFCLWDSHGHLYGSRGGSVSPLAPGKGAATREIPAIVPQTAINGPRVRLPYLGREYMLFHGPVGAALKEPFGGEWDQSPNMWWPADRAWFVATEIDYPWTYVGGTTEMIQQILDDDRIEAIRAPVPGQHRRVEWIRELAARAADRLLQQGHVFVETSAGTVEAWLEKGEVRTQSVSEGGFESSSRSFQAEPDHLKRHLESSIIRLVGPH